MNDTFRYTLIPVILGANFEARVCAIRYRRRFRVRSIVMGDTHSPTLFFSLSLRYRRLSKNIGYTDFILADLIRLTEEFPDKLLVLTATTPHYAALIRENQSLLERYYILSDPTLSFLSQGEAPTSLLSERRTAHDK